MSGHRCRGNSSHLAEIMSYASAFAFGLFGRLFSSLFSREKCRPFGTFLTSPPHPFSWFPFLRCKFQPKLTTGGASQARPLHPAPGPCGDRIPHRRRGLLRDAHPRSFRGGTCRQICFFIHEELLVRHIFRISHSPTHILGDHTELIFATYD